MTLQGKQQGSLQWWQGRRCMFENCCLKYKPQYLLLVVIMWAVSQCIFGVSNQCHTDLDAFWLFTASLHAPEPLCCQFFLHTSEAGYLWPLVGIDPCLHATTKHLMLVNTEQEMWKDRSKKKRSSTRCAKPQGWEGRDQSPKESSDIWMQTQAFAISQLHPPADREESHAPFQVSMQHP